MMINTTWQLPVERRAGTWSTGQHLAFTFHFVRGQSNIWREGFLSVMIFLLWTVLGQGVAALRSYHPLSTEYNKLMTLPSPSPCIPHHMWRAKNNFCYFYLALLWMEYGLWATAAPPSPPRKGWYNAFLFKILELWVLSGSTQQLVCTTSGRRIRKIYFKWVSKHTTDTRLLRIGIHIHYYSVSPASSTHSVSCLHVSPLPCQCLL